MSGNPTYRAGSSSFSLSGIVHDLMVSWKLLLDPAVPGLLKLVLPIGALIYWFSPIDIIPGMPFDDIAILLLAAKFFVSLAPRDSVNRANSSKKNADSPKNASDEDDGEIIDTTWRVVDE